MLLIENLRHDLVCIYNKKTVAFTKLKSLYDDIAIGCISFSWPNQSPICQININDDLLLWPSFEVEVAIFFNFQSQTFSLLS